MNFNEALQVLRRINVHHGNAPISDAQAQCFYEELSRSVSFDEANAAVREFYALHPHGEWMTVGDINLAVRRKRRQSMPSEATITRLMEENQISDPDEMWQFRRSLLKSLGRGRPATQAVQRALELSRHPMLDGPRGRGDEKRRTLGSAASGGIAPRTSQEHRIKKTPSEKTDWRKNKWQTSPHKQSETPSWTTFPKT